MSYFPEEVKEEKSKFAYIVLTVTIHQSKTFDRFGLSIWQTKLNKRLLSHHDCFPRGEGRDSTVFKFLTSTPKINKR